MILKKLSYPGHQRALGFSLLEIAIVLLIIAIIGAATLNISTGAIQAKRRVATLERGEAIQAAITLFVSQSKRLPCPADGAAAQGTVNAGKELRPTQDCGVQTTGTVPYLALGLTEEVTTDGWNNRFTYRVAGGLPSKLTFDNGMDMTLCDVSGTEPGPPTPPRACNTACVTTATLALALSCTKPQDFLATKGLTIQDASGTTLAAPSTLPPFNGVAYVLISHGENFAGAYNSQGILIAGTGVVGTNETTNSNNQPLKTTYIDAQYDGSQSTAHFDDLIFRPTIAQIIDHAKLSARAR